MHFLHIPKIVTVTGTLLCYEENSGKHYPQYTFKIEEEAFLRTDKDAIEKLYDKETVYDLLKENLPKEIMVMYDAKNHEDSKPIVLT